jgi:hypothetical protein
MTGLRLTFAGATLALAVSLAGGHADALSLKRCDDSGHELARGDCISPTFPEQSRGPCGKGACYRGATHHHRKKTKT